MPDYPAGDIKVTFVGSTFTSKNPVKLFFPSMSAIKEILPQFCSSCLKMSKEEKVL